MAVFWPETSPAIPPDPDAPRGMALARRLIEVLVAPVLLIVAVLGSILGGLATPTEAASVGAVGAILLALLKVRAADFGRVLVPVVHRTAQITCMIFVILIGATLFSLVFRGLGGDDMVHRALGQSAGRRGRRDPRGHGRDVPARLRDGCLRDHLRGGADRRARRCWRCRASIRSGSAS